ncbi:tyrosine-type recombinase/integrase [Pseudomonas sp. NY15436]|uniref:tyrosine-type recombinase/integrase n=1 Tax=Pseudomonas sp. NY15436 TaxID=3400359 RepID=UPI003A85C7AA
MANVRMVLFKCWARLSLSEIIALGVDDVDREAGGVWMKRARVITELKVPTEHARLRFVELTDPFLALLDDIFKDAECAAPMQTTVTHRDNVTEKQEEVRLLFRNCISGLPWTAKTVSKWLTPHLKRNGVRHRGANQCRHTFANQALSSYVPVEWVARQLGHTDATMVRKHYGRWIPTDTKSMASLVSQMMGFREQA